MPGTTVHACRPLHVAGVLRSTCTAHYWQPVGRIAADPAKAGAR